MALCHCRVPSSFSLTVLDSISCSGHITWGKFCCGELKISQTVLILVRKTDIVIFMG